MTKTTFDWSPWVSFFARRASRRLPPLEDANGYKTIPPSVARSLAIFQLGESGGGSIVEQCRQSRLPCVDEDYARAVELFVREEHRHAEILAICVRNLGGKLIRQNWTARLFVFARRLIGLRLKVLVLLAAEVIGICYYHLLATRLPRSRLKSLLSQLVNDERSHLHFHCTFLSQQIHGMPSRLMFAAAWRLTIVAAAAVVLIDHYRTLQDLGVHWKSVWRRWMTYSALAEELVLGSRNQEDGFLDFHDEDHRPERWQPERASCAGEFGMSA